MYISRKSINKSINATHTKLNAKIQYFDVLHIMQLFIDNKKQLMTHILEIRD